MRCLYLDNFRGFKDTIIPILDVNFLVGENSTGKTSALMMLQIMSARALLIGLQGVSAFSSPMELLPFGHYAEMVSAHSEDKTYFRLGIADSAPRSPGAPAISNGVFITFREMDGMAFVSQITCVVAGREIYLQVDEHEVAYAVSDAPKGDEAKDARHALKRWVKFHSADKGDVLTKIMPPKGVNAKRTQLLMLLSIVQSRIAQKDTDAGELETIIPYIWPEPVVLAPIRTKPLRTYSEPYMPYSPEGMHTPYVIRRMLTSESSAAKFRKFIDKVGKESGLFEKIEITYFSPEKTGPFEVDVVLGGAALSLDWVGYGVSQSLPILVELIFRPKGTWFTIQQPEVHLHPRAQAALGDAFFEMALLDRKVLLIETHSDFAIDRFRMNYRRKFSKKDQFSLPKGQILFFERHGIQNIVTPIDIDERGDLSEHQPETYRRFFIREELRLIGTH